MSAVLDQASELERLLLEHNVTVFGYERREHTAIVRFTMNERKLRLVVKMPDYSDEAYRLTPSRREIRAVAERQRLYWRDVAATWKSMRNLIAAKIEGIEAGITTFDAEFSQFDDGVALLEAGKDDDE